MDPVAFAHTTGPQRPPPSRDAGAYAPVPRALRVASAALSIAAVAAAAVLWLAEVADAGGGSTALAGLSLGLTLGAAGAGLPLLFRGPLSRYLSPRERRVGLAVTGLLPVLCWLLACWPEFAAVLGWS